MGPPPTDHAARVARARLSLEGLSLGDAFGDRFFVPPDLISFFLDNRALPGAPWLYTDDTVMALSIVELLELHGSIDPDLLARAFAAKYVADPDRGYGGDALPFGWIDYRESLERMAWIGTERQRD
jgi:hypothetical protein